MRLAGKTAIVTGGASGFGAEIAATFVREGAKVVVADIDGVAAERRDASEHADAEPIHLAAPRRQRGGHRLGGDGDIEDDLQQHGVPRGFPTRDE